MITALDLTVRVLLVVGLAWTLWVIARTVAGEWPHWFGRDDAPDEVLGGPVTLDPRDVHVLLDRHLAAPLWPQPDADGITGCWASVWSDRVRDLVDCGRRDTNAEGVCPGHAALLARGRPA